ncbi:phosphoribosylglycinamide formyltransferase 2 [Striga asiatica]|uniref:Phosphoribosylglycinamide formyltransferase 2 n=1 Tax=Striga asiatica TaxID=4170 RepID=A0A5A7R6N2_STRAF|nr:phosphoribosylglycinamide formyltransferase 2 [Striga asiatica]
MVDVSGFNAVGLEKRNPSVNSLNSKIRPSAAAAPAAAAIPAADVQESIRLRVHALTRARIAKQIARLQAGPTGPKPIKQTTILGPARRARQQRAETAAHLRQITKMPLPEIVQLQGQRPAVVLPDPAAAGRRQMTQLPLPEIVQLQGKRLALPTGHLEITELPLFGAVGFGGQRRLVPLLRSRPLGGGGG